MHPRNAKPSVIFAILLAVAVGTASWLGFRNGSPEQFVQSTQTFAQGGPVDATATNKGPKNGAVIAQSAAAVDQKPIPSGKRLFTAPVWGQAELPPATPESSYASRAILATATLDVKTMPMLKQLHKGDHVVLPLGAGAEIEGVVNLVVPQDSGWVQVAGGFSAGQKGSFMLSQSVSDSKVWGGQIVREDQHVGYVISTANGRVKIDKKPLNAIMCESLPAAKLEAAAVDPTTPPAPAGATPDNSDGADAAVPVLDSKPGAHGVLYLDFDGETVTDASWNGGVTIFAAAAQVAGKAITTAQITDIWSRVSEDFSPYNVTVTTDLSVYNAAPVGERMRCIVTPTSAWYTTNVGGITWTGSYRGPAAAPAPFSATVPCWVFNSSSTSTIALTCSHELGHALGLSHDGAPGVSYYAGHDTGATSWGPIMGAPYGRSVTQWNNGSYPNASNNENDLVVMAATIHDAGVVQGFVTDEAGNDFGSAAILPITSPINQTGIITQSSDLDWYQLKASAGTINITVTAALVDPNVDTELKLYDVSGGGLMKAALPLATSLNSNITYTLPATPTGVFYLSVGGKGRAAAPLASPPVIGYNNYGSVGRYTLTGTYVTVPVEPTITVQPAPITIANQGTKVTLSVTVMSNSPVTYQWKKNGVNMPGKTASTLVFTSVQIADDNVYTVEVKNTATVNNTKLSDPAVLGVNHKPAIVAKLTPASSTVVAGANASFAVTVTDPGRDAANVTNYVWKKNNVVIPVGTNASAGTATLTLPAVDFYAAGSYTCTVSNTIGFVTSTAAILTVTSPPLFKVDLPAVKHIATGTTFTASVTVVGTAPFTYKWFKDGSVIPGATKSTYAIKSTASGTYWVEATGNATATSTHMLVDAQDKPAIAIAGQPTAATTLDAGTALSLSVSATGSATLLYQWQFNSMNLVDGGAISGSTTDHLIINPVAFVNQGTFRCIVTNAVGTVTSKNAVVTVKSPPVIVTPPLPIKIAIGGTGVLKVGAIGTPTLKYLWSKDTGSGYVPVPGGTGPTLTLTRATATATAPATPTEGDYKVTISNTQAPAPGGVTSIPVHVTVFAAPKITTQPQTPLISAVGRTEHFSVVATGGGTLTYQWQKNNKDILGQTTDTLTFPSLVTADAGTYRCIVKNEVGTATSAGGVLSVLIAPAITVHPISINAYVGTTISMLVTATGSPTLAYQWEKETAVMGVFSPVPLTTTLANTTASTTAKTAAMKLTALKTFDAGKYRVVVSNPKLPSSAVTSVEVTLTITPVPLPVITDFTPHKAKVTELFGGSYQSAQILLFGQDLNFTTKVRIGTVNASFVLNGHTEIIITVPAGLPLNTPLQITVENSTGTATSVSTFTGLSSSLIINASTNPPNDDIINAQLLFRPGAGGLGFIAAPGTDTTAATSESIDDGPYHTVWYHWRPAVSGNYHISTSGSAFWAWLQIWTGPAIPVGGPTYYNTMTFLGAFYDARIDHGLDADGNIDAVKGQDYYICLEGFATTGVGSAQLLIYKNTAAQKVDVDPVYDSATSAEEMGLTSSVGGSAAGASEVSVAWLPTTASPAGSIVTAKADLSIDTTIGTNEMFSWSVSDRSGTPVFSLTFDAATGHILSQAAGEGAQQTGQVFLPGSVYGLSLEADYSRGVWGASLNGVEILSDQPLSAAAIENGFGDVAAVWVPAKGAAKGGKMNYGNFSVYAAKPEGGK